MTGNETTDLPWFIVTKGDETLYAQGVGPLAAARSAVDQLNADEGLNGMVVERADYKTAEFIGQVGIEGFRQPDVQQPNGARIL